MDLPYNIFCESVATLQIKIEGKRVRLSVSKHGGFVRTFELVPNMHFALLLLGMRLDAVLLVTIWILHTQDTNSSLNHKTHSNNVTL